MSVTPSPTPISSKTWNINAETCMKCGACVAVCPVDIIEQPDKTAAPGFVADQTGLCIQCGHCMMVCPSKAVQSAGLNYDADFTDPPESIADAGAFEGLLVTRRSVRVFQNKPVEKTILDRIVSMVAMAPMGFPPANVEITVVSDRAVIDAALPDILTMYRKAVKLWSIPPARWLLKLFIPGHLYNVLNNHIVPEMRYAFQHADIEGFDPITRDAPAMILFHADKRSESHIENIQIAQTYAALAAHACGLGATIIGLVPPIIEHSASLRKLFGIPARHDVLGCVIVGYPKLRFLRTIRRPLAAVHHIDGSDKKNPADSKSVFAGGSSC